MPSTSSRSWKMERASVSSQSKKRPRSNKYRKNDGPTPKAGSRSRVWVGGHSRDGVRVKGYFRSIGNRSGNG